MSMKKEEWPILHVLALTTLCFVARTGAAAGPNCLSCNVVKTPSDCNTTVQCGENEACFISNYSTFGEDRYRMGCMNTQYCSNKELSLVGKRQTQSSGQHGCSVCCKGDLCNLDACRQSQTGSQQLYPLLTLGTADSCVDRNQATCLTFGQLSKDACRLQNVADTCPRSCGLCEYFGWGSWSPYGACSRTCNPGLMVRYRKCRHQLSATSGQTCRGPDNEPQPCLNMFCSAMTTSTIGTTTIIIA